MNKLIIILLHITTVLCCNCIDNQPEIKMTLMYEREVYVNIVITFINILKVLIMFLYNFHILI